MTRFKHTRSSLFLIELIIAILFFSVGSAVCIRAFAQAHQMSQAASDLSFASAQVSSAASVVRYTDGTPEAIAVYFPGAAAVDGGACAIYYDDEHQLCASEDAAYTLTIRTEEADGRTEASLSMTGTDGGVIYELNLHYPSMASQEEGETYEF